MEKLDLTQMPDKDGFFGEFGGQFVPDYLKKIMDDINEAYEKIIKDI